MPTLLLLLVPLVAGIQPRTMPRHLGFTRPEQLQPALTRRALAGFAVLGLAASAASASSELNEAELKLAAILERKVKEREASLGFALDKEDIADLENILRTKYCGPFGAYSGEPGGTCKESPPAAPTCFKSPNGKYSSSMSFATQNNPCAGMK